MANVFIKRPGKDTFNFPKAQVVTAVKRGELLGDDEISADGKNWIRLDRHKQLGALFKTKASKPKAPTKPKKVNEVEFFSSDRVNCPKCGFDQDRADTCMECGIVFQKYFDSKKPKPPKEEPGERISQDEPITEDVEDASGNFIVRVLKKLGRGDYPLVTAFWRFGFVVPLVMGLLFVAWMFFGLSVLPQFLFALGLLSAFPLFFGYGIISSVGIWRSASAYSGPSIWSVLSKILVVLYFIGLPFQIIDYFKSLPMFFMLVVS